MPMLSTKVLSELVAVTFRGNDTHKKAPVGCAEAGSQWSVSGFLFLPASQVAGRHGRSSVPRLDLRLPLGPPQGLLIQA
jgi:hypothetical protein